jgi:hypothetical protein
VFAGAGCLRKCPITGNRGQRALYDEKLGIALGQAIPPIHLPQQFKLTVKPKQIEEEIADDGGGPDDRPRLPQDR